MDLSVLKWPAIVIGVIAVGWLMTEGGTQWIYNQSTDAIPGENPKQDKIDEARLTSLGTYSMAIFRWKKAKKVLTAAYKRYPDGEHAWHNYYRLARVHEKLGEYQEAADIIHEIWQQRDHKRFPDDKRIPNKDQLHRRMITLIEVHQLKFYDDIRFD